MSDITICDKKGRELAGITMRSDDRIYWTAGKTGEVKGSFDYNDPKEAAKALRKIADQLDPEGATEWLYLLSDDDD